MSDYSFDHILRLTDEVGMFEHADHTAPRREHGYCTDDMARLLIVIAREPAPTRAVRDLGHTALGFLTDAQGTDGRIRNRRTATGRWKGERTVEDCWGRSLWAFGTAVRHDPHERMRQIALMHFERGAERRSPWRRSMAFGALGAAEVLAAQPGHDAARLLLSDAADAVGPLASDPRWPWPETRLSYANAVLPEVLLASGHLLERPGLVADGLVLLAWLLERETLDGHLSPTPVGGSGPGDRAPAFDQQPIEIAAMADACHRAFAMTGDNTWRAGIEMAAKWFEGQNDAGAVMWDHASSGGYDGLHAHRCNLNQGAESTMALVSTLQHVSRLDRCTPAVATLGP